MKWHLKILAYCQVSSGNSVDKSYYDYFYCYSSVSSVFSVMALVIMVISGQNFRETVSEMDALLRECLWDQYLWKNEESRIEQRRCLNAFTRKVSAYPF